MQRGGERRQAQWSGCAATGAKNRMRRAVQVCNRPDVDVTRVVCLPNLQGLLAAAAADYTPPRTRVYSDNFKSKVQGYEK
jgi:hypothetical protein